MGDIANMTDCDGRVNGHRLLRWLRSRIEVETAEMERMGDWAGDWDLVGHEARMHLLREMADDLERELTPPDYPDDDGDTVDLDDPALSGGPEVPCGQ